ncbi:hypothetical protein GCM10027034_29970 [Ramlibacter solisilvae]|uniref:peptidoglycan glycosyltransferase n=1 Tax=Ramlibacter tataouinensis TaxID=94132 RepID=A0A127JRI6_9BURK|nr:penicillin-binding protein 1C [Ramlibacter tataouinensis]AMO22581.1 penicillin-binding protein [Ramlibacter tataouinensis]
MKRWLATLLFACALQAQALPSFEEVRGDWRASETLVLDRNGQLLQRVRTDMNVRRGEWVPLADVSPALLTALVYSEDRRFWEHSGVDWRAVPAAAWANLWNRRTRGASTITMQLAGLLDEAGRSPGGRSVGQKITQAAAATRLETLWRKDQILEAYLNLVPFRGELVGVDALSRTLFGKAPHGLDAEEGAIAAVLVRAPNAGAHQVAQRACAALREAQGLRECAGIAVRTEAALARRAFAPSEGIAPHFARMLLRGTPAAPARISTTLRADVQRFASASLRQHLRELRQRSVEDGSVVVLDNASGEVLAWVGSSGDLSDAQEVDGVTALRQAGSTLKPFLYAQALAQRRLTAASLLDDSAAAIPTAAGLYIPQNYDHHFKGWVSARTALGASLNVPAVRALVMVTPEAMARTLQAAGLPLRDSGDYYGYSLALGSAEVPLLGLANAYRTLANGGRFAPVRWTRTASPAAQAIDPAAAFIVGDILSDPNARARTFGTDSLLATRMWTAVKTGTSKDMRDNWAVGWSSRYTVGVWVGNASGAPMHDVSGTSGAAPVWAAVMRHLHADLPSRAPAPPPGLVRVRVQFADALEAAREEWFLAGTEQALVAVHDERASRHIRSPAEGTIVALDPDIPAARQRLQFTAGSPAVRWRVDGREFARGAQAAWLPWPGRHLIQLTDERGAVLDEVRIEVRGAGLKVAGGAGQPRAK